MQVVDPHVHFWDADALSYSWLDRAQPAFSGNTAALPRVYLPGTLLAEAGEIEVLKVVHVEAIQDPGTMPGEVDWTQALAEYPLSRGMPEGIVAGIDLLRPDAQVLLADAAAHPNVRGIRQVLNRHRDPWYNYVAIDYLAEPSWCAHFALLREFGLSFDLQLYPSQVKAALALIDAHPATPCIVNHTGMFVDRDSPRGYRAWRDGLLELARRPNVAIKISGLAMFDHRWTTESFRPYVLEAIDAFGTERCMFASNFPIDRLHGTYSSLWHAYAEIVGGATDAERHGMFVENAERTYRI